MEVKIKIGGEIIDAKIVMMNGDMIVSPKVEKFEPKDGDVIYVKSSNDNIIIYKEDASAIGRYVNFSNNEYLYTDDNFVCDKDSVKEIRYATEKEKKLLFDKLKEEGWEWDSEKKELVKLKWKPESGDIFYRPLSTYGRFDCYKTRFNHSCIDKAYISKGWCFRTKEECESFCKKLNQAIEGVKP